MSRPRTHNGICAYEEDWAYCRTCSKWILKTSSELVRVKSKALVHAECKNQVSTNPRRVSTRHRLQAARGVKWID